MLCLLCIDDIHDGDEIKCSSCKEFLHFSCASFRESVFRKLSPAAKNKFTCSNCKTNTVEFSKDKNVNNIFESNDPITSRKTNTVVISKDKNVNNIIESNDSLTTLTRSVNFLSSQFDEFGKQLKEVLKTIKELKNENNLLKEKNQVLNNELSALSKRVNMLEQNSISNYIEIIGIPEVKKENCIKIVESIAEKLDQKVTVNKAYRIISKFQNKSSKIVAEISSLDQKKKIMEASKKIKMNASSVNKNWGETGIYINNYLTKYNSELFYNTRNFAKENDYKFVWFKDSKIFIKKNEEARVFIIYDKSDLLNIHKPLST